MTGDGVEREVDAIIFGTGFQVTDMPVGRLVRGRGGTTLADSGRAAPGPPRQRPSPGFPNLFMLLGPNTGLGHSSMVYMIESQVAYVMDALRRCAPRRRHGRGARGRRRALQRRPRRAHAGHGLEHRLRELVPRRDRPQRDAVARLDLALPPRTARFDPADFELTQRTPG